jgi:hypothetical protein
MTVRPFRESDRDALSEIAASAGFPYPDFDSPLIETLLVLTDENDAPITALCASRHIQLYFYPAIGLPTMAHMHVIRLLSEAMKENLRTKGYNECDAYLSPEIERSFGRRLVRSFGAVKNWASYYFRF